MTYRTRKDLKRVIVHCAATPDFSQIDFGVEHIRQWHLERGWSDCGYHWVIKRDGTLEPGRPESRQGTHCRGENKDSIGVCLIGSEGFTRAQFYTLFLFLCRTTEELDIGLDKWFCHNEFDRSKLCPGFSKQELIARMVGDYE